MEYQEHCAPNKPEQQLDRSSQELLGAAALGSPTAAPLAGDSSSEEGSSGGSCSTHNGQLAGQCCIMADEEQQPRQQQQQQEDDAQHYEDGEQDLEPEVILTITEPQEHHHHLLRHCLNADQRRQALQHFGSDDVREAAREIGRMGQRELQLKFKLVYGNATHSNNNNWLRRKLYEAVGAAPMKVPTKVIKAQRSTTSSKHCGSPRGAMGSGREGSPPPTDRVSLRCHHHHQAGAGAASAAAGAAAGGHEGHATRRGAAAHSTHSMASLATTVGATRPRSPRGAFKSTARPALSNLKRAASAAAPSPHHGSPGARQRAMVPLRRHHTLPAELPPVPQLYQPLQAQHPQPPAPLQPQQHQRFFHFKREQVEGWQHGQQPQHANVAGVVARQAQGMPSSAFFTAAVGAGVMAAASPVYQQTSQNLDSIMEDLGLLDDCCQDGWLSGSDAAAGPYGSGGGSSSSDSGCWGLLGPEGANNLLGCALGPAAPAGRAGLPHSGSLPSSVGSMATSPSGSESLLDAEEDLLLLPVDPFAMDAFAFI
ncbi:hypothetical protein N2152v2_003679 [Parachlorella kessleri]